MSHRRRASRVDRARDARRRASSRARAPTSAVVRRDALATALADASSPTTTRAGRAAIGDATTLKRAMTGSSGTSPRAPPTTVEPASGWLGTVLGQLTPGKLARMLFSTSVAAAAAAESDAGETRAAAAAAAAEETTAAAAAVRGAGEGREARERARRRELAKVARVGRGTVG